MEFIQAADIHTLLLTLGVFVGMFLHVVKKWQQDGTSRKSFFATMSDWFLDAHGSTIGTIVAGVSAAVATIPETGSLLMLLGRSIIVGIGANSVVNRPGDSQ